MKPSRLSLIAACSLGALSAFAADAVPAANPIPASKREYPADLNPFSPKSMHHGPAGYVPPEGLAPGAAFVDRILPLPEGRVRSDVWGVAMVGPRQVDNGLEDPAWSYWCSSVHRNAKTGKYEMIASRWAESAPKGHMAWPASRLVFAEADAPAGPFRQVGAEIGGGHNPWVYRAKDGSWVCYHIGGARTAPALAGPWTDLKLDYETRGTPSGEMTNHTFAPREDGSVLMVSRGGRSWISRDGKAPFRKITNARSYPVFPGAYEDPCVWRDEVQYNLIVNDWYGRLAYYLRSPDGVHWVRDEGAAYTPHIVKRADGAQEKWWKLERPAVLQDEYGRATHLYAAAIDTLKLLDKGGDEHSSKVLALPLRVQRRLEILPGAEGAPLRVRVRAEPGFDPKRDLDTGSLRFGSPASVDFGGGAAVVSTVEDGADIVLTFARVQAGLLRTDFAAKLLGRDRKGSPVFGFARVPGWDFAPALLSLDGISPAGGKLPIAVENGGLSASIPRPLRVIAVGSDNREIGSRALLLPAIAPCGRYETTVDLPENWCPPGAKLVVELPGNGEMLTSRVEANASSK